MRWGKKKTPVKVNNVGRQQRRLKRLRHLDRKKLIQVYMKVMINTCLSESELNFDWLDSFK